MLVQINKCFRIYRTN